jgi:hypothetical protein
MSVDTDASPDLTVALPANIRTKIQGDKVIEYLISMDPSPVAEAS